MQYVALCTFVVIIMMNRSIFKLVHLTPSSHFLRVYFFRAFFAIHARAVDAQEL